MTDFLTPLLARKAAENRRRSRHVGLYDPRSTPDGPSRLAAVHEALRRVEGQPPRVIAEIKFRSPSAGPIRPWQPGADRLIATGYVEAGASAISVLCDGRGFGGGVTMLRRVAKTVPVPVLFKEFVLDSIQVDLARAAGASMVLLLVRALSVRTLRQLIAACEARGLAPVVEAANAKEVTIAAESGAQIIGVNARDLKTFRVEPRAALKALDEVPKGRIRVFMSGVSTTAELARVAATSTDAVLIGSSLMGAANPGRKLASLLGGLQPWPS